MTNISQQADADLPRKSLLGKSLTEAGIVPTLVEYGFTGFVWFLALISAGLLFWMIWVVLKDAMPAVSQYGLEFLWGGEWESYSEVYGALPFIYGTLVSSIMALTLALPLGVAVALVTSEDFLPKQVQVPIAFTIELIAAIPSVIVGLWGVYVLVPFLKPIQTFIYNILGWFPLFSTEPFGLSMFSAGVLLAIMIVPIVASISREVLLAAPRDLRSASMSLGATRWETIWRVILPTASSGIIGAAVLALGRALGETLAVTMVIGNSTQISPSLFAPGYTIPALLVNEFGEAIDELHVGALMYLGLILFAITLIVNATAVLMVQLISNRFTRT